MAHYRHYLLGTTTRVITDHIANHWILSKGKPKSAIAPRHMRWALKLQEYDYDIEYKPGRLHKNADALSRPPIVPLSHESLDEAFDPEDCTIADYDAELETIGLQVDQGHSTATKKLFSRAESRVRRKTQTPLPPTPLKSHRQGKTTMS